MFLPLIDFLRLVRDSEPDIAAPVVVLPSCRRAWIRMVTAMSFHPEVLRKAGVKPQELRDCGCANVIRDAGFTATELLKQRKQHRAFSLRDLVEIGYSTLELREAGFSLETLATEHFTLQELFDGGFAIEEWRDIGVTLPVMLAAGFTLQDFRIAGFDLSELRSSGFTPQEFLDRGCTLVELRRAGFLLRELQRAGLTPPQLRESGFRAQDIRRAGVTADRLFQDCHFTFSGVTTGGIHTSRAGGRRANS